MKIVFIDSDPQYLLGLPWGLSQLGCKVKIIKEIREDSLAEVFKNYQPDLVFTAGWTKIHTRSNLEVLGELLKRYRIKHAYWSTEDPRWTDRWSLPFIEATRPDYIFTIDKGSVPFYRERGCRAYYLTWACNPQYHRPAAPRREYSCDIALVATAGVTWSSYRRDSARILLKPLVERKYNILIWGKRWDKLDPEIVGFDVAAENLRGKLPYQETNHVYSSAKIVLGFQNLTTDLTARTFEILGARGFMLAPATEAVLHSFKPGKHLVVSRSEEETVRLVDYYLEHEEERKQIALQGQKEVYASYTYRHRALEVLKAISNYKLTPITSL
jgi:spore maturation protein CgeB